MIDLKTLRELVKLMVANDLTELDLEDQGERVSLKRGRGEPQVHYVPAPHHAAAAVPPPAAQPPAHAGAGAAANGGPAAAAEPAASAGGQAGAAAEAGLVPITSPMVGTFYAASGPDAKPFVAVGDRVTPDTVVCIIEAMKVFNEIKAESAGTIDKVLVGNGQAVEFGQPLFMIKPG